MTVHTSLPPNFVPTIAAAGCFIESDDEILYLKRAPSRPEPLTWSVPGGKLEPGEDPRSAVIREVFEEVGLFIDTPNLVYLGPLYITASFHYTFHIFRKSFSRRPTLALKLDEHTESLWLAPPISLPLIPGGLEALNFYLKHK